MQAPFDAKVMKERMHSIQLAPADLTQGLGEQGGPGIDLGDRLCA